MARQSRARGRDEGHQELTRTNEEEASTALVPSSHYGGRWRSGQGGGCITVNSLQSHENRTPPRCSLTRHALPSPHRQRKVQALALWRTINCPITCNKKFYFILINYIQQDNENHFTGNNTQINVYVRYPLTSAGTTPLYACADFNIQMIQTSLMESLLLLHAHKPKQWEKWDHSTMKWNELTYVTLSPQYRMTHVCMRPTLKYSHPHQLWR
jgi:hypothetical protein